jgi:protein-S-isoprenylcysteine O-methyltransferase Ste14
MERADPDSHNLRMGDTNRRLSAPFRAAGRFVLIIAGTSGIRLDRLLDAEWRKRHGVGIVVLQLWVVAAVLAVQAALPATLVVGVGAFVLGWTAYYFGNYCVLGTSLARRWRARVGSERAYAQYELVLALMFQLQGLAVYQVSRLAWSDVVPGETEALAVAAPELRVGLALAFLAVGMSVKLWATWIAGLDAYYYRDMFQDRRAASGFVARGPYRILNNPMYGLGNLHTYGIALLAGSTPGLLAAAVCHLSIYAFYWSAEAPFVERQYLAKAPDSDALRP